MKRKADIKGNKMEFTCENTRDDWTRFLDNSIVTQRKDTCLYLSGCFLHRKNRGEQERNFWDFCTPQANESTLNLESDLNVNHEHYLNFPENQLNPVC